MTSHHDPSSPRASKNSPVSFQWDLDQELQDHITRVRRIMSSPPLNPSIRVCDTNINQGDKEIDNTHTHTHTPYSPPLSLSLSEDPDNYVNPEDVRKWLIEAGITCANYLLRHYSIPELIDAQDDYVNAVESGMRIRNPTGFFRSLLGERRR